MRKVMWLWTLLTALFAGNAFAALTLASSTFDADNEGWTSIGLDANGNSFAAPALIWNSASGNPGGATQYGSPINPPYTAWFSAPANIVAALHGAGGGSISWDISTVHDASAAYLGGTRADIAIFNGTANIRMIVTAPSGPASSPSFSHYSVDLGSAGGWFFGGVAVPATQAQIDGVVQGATLMRIRADYFDRTNPTATLLDNVTITAAVPEPATWVMFGVGLMLAAVAARRRDLSVHSGRY